MNKLLLFLFSLLSFATLTSCGTTNSDLVIDFATGTSYVLPQGEVSCNQILTLPANGTETQDIQPNTLQYRNQSISFTWKNTTDSVTIISIQFTFKNDNISGGEFDCLIAGDELYSIFGNFSTKTEWSGTIAAKTTTPVTNTTCPLTCGGFHVTDKNKPFTAMGTVSAIGIQTSPSGDQKTVKGTAQVKLIYQGGFL